MKANRCLPAGLFYPRGYTLGSFRSHERRETGPRCVATSCTMCMSRFAFLCLLLVKLSLQPVKQVGGGGDGIKPNSCLAVLGVHVSGKQTVRHRRPCPRRLRGSDTQKNYNSQVVHEQLRCRDLLGLINGAVRWSLRQSISELAFGSGLEN